MSVTSANVNDLATFVNTTIERVGRLVSTLESVGTKHASVSSASTFQQPSTPSLNALNELVTAWDMNAGFVLTVHDALVAANQFSGDGMATVSSAAVDAALASSSFATPPAPVEVEESVLFGQPPYSGFIDDPICLANGNLLLRDGDLEVFGLAAPLTVVRTYNSRDRRSGTFGPGWSSLLDVSLDVADAVVQLRAHDGSGYGFRRLADGGWSTDRRRRLRLEADDDAGGWTVHEGRRRRWHFDGDGVLVAFRSDAADVVLERTEGEVRALERHTGRWVRYVLGAGGQRVHRVESSDGRAAEHSYDEAGQLVHVRRERGDVTYDVDERGLLLRVVDADGVVVCENSYDRDGRVLTQVEAHGRTTAYDHRDAGVVVVTADDDAPPNVMVHDRQGRLTAMIDGAGNTMRFAYDHRGDVAQIVDRTGAVTRFTHDDAGNVVQKVDPDGRTERWRWDHLDRLVAASNRAGATTTFGYDGERREPVLLTQGDGSTIRCTYDDAGLLTSVADDDGAAHRIERDGDGLVVAVVDGAGHRTSFTYDAAGRTVGCSVPERDASLTLDDRGRMSVLRTPEGEQHFRYSDAGRLVGGRGPRGRPWHVALDDAGEVAELVDGFGRTTTYERDSIGRIITAATGASRATWEYDPVGRVVARTDAAGGRTEYGYDPEGRAVLHTDPTGRTWSRELDAMGRVGMAVAPDGATTSTSFHAGRRPATVVDAAGHQWRHEVDVMGRVTSSTDPTGATTTYRYTPAGRLAEVHSPLGRVVRYEYDEGGVLVRLVGPDGAVAPVVHAGGGRPVLVPAEVRPVPAPVPPLHFELDDRGLVVGVVDAAGVATEIRRDELGRMVATSTGGVTTTTLAYDAADRITSLTDAHGRTAALSRDARGAIEHVAHPDGTGTRRTYGPDGRLSGARLDDGTSVLEVARDELGAVVGVRAGDGVLSIRRDPLSRPVAVTTDAGTVTYRWDADGQLAALGDGGHRIEARRRAGGAVESFVLADGRRVARPAAPAVQRDERHRVARDEDGRRYAYDLAGRLAEVTTSAGTTRYEYDDRGLLATEHRPDGVRTHRHGPAGELLSLLDEHGTTTAFAYDLAGRRTSERRDDGTTVSYSWDPSGRLRSVAVRNPDGSEVRRTVEHDPAGRPVRVDGVPVLWDGVVSDAVLGIGEERYLRCEGQVLETTDPDAGWSRRLADDPWGDDGGTDLRVGPRGVLALDGLVFLGARVYDTRTRAFLSRDPLLATPGRLLQAGPYAYAGNDPVNMVDPTGLEPLSDEAYQAQQNGWLANNWESVVGATVGIVVTVGVTALLTPVLGPGALIVGGAAGGLVSGGLTTALEGGDLGDIGRDALIGGAFGAAGGVLSRFIPTSVATNVVQRTFANTAGTAAVEYPLGFAQEAADSYLPGGDGRFDLDMALLNGTTATLGGVGSAEVQFRQGQATGNPPPPDSGPAPTPDGADSGAGSGSGTGSGSGADGGPGAGSSDGFAGEPPDAIVPPSSSTNLNTAIQADIDAIPGFGERLSQRVIAERERLGGSFTSADQLLEIDQIGPARQQDLIDALGL